MQNWELATIANDSACPLASVSVLAIRGGEVACQQQAGPATERSLYRIASVSKLVSTLAALRLVEQGMLALDTDVSHYLGFSLRNPHYPDCPLTLRMLLTHTASLRDDAGYSWPCAVTLHSVLAPGQSHYGSGAMWARTRPSDFFTYSNLGWGVIGTIMEAVTGERFDRLMRRLLLAPLGMEGGFNPSEFSPGELANTATLYRKRTTDTEAWDPAGPWIAQVDDYRVSAPVRPPGIDEYLIGTNATPFSPTGGLRASAAGLARVMLMLMNDGVHEGAQFLQPATLRQMFARHWTFDGANGDTQGGLYYGWGLGMQHFPDLPGGRLVAAGGFSGLGHLGEAYGLHAVFAFDPVARDGMIVLVGGVGSDPAACPGSYSSLRRFEERILSALHQEVILGNSARL